MTSIISFTWKIKDFKDSYAEYNEKGIKSSEFTIRGEGDRVSRWMLEIKRVDIYSSAPLIVHLHSKNAGSFEQRNVRQ